MVGEGSDGGWCGTRIEERASIASIVSREASSGWMMRSSSVLVCVLSKLNSTAISIGRSTEGEREAIRKPLKKSKWGWEASSEEDLVSGRPREVLLRKNDTSGRQKGDAAVRDSPSYAETERCALTIGCRALWRQRPRSLDKKGRKVSKVGT